MPIIYNSGIINYLRTTGTYTGNQVQNRAIPHGLGIKPTLVIIFRVGTATNIHYCINGQAKMWQMNVTTFSLRDVTEMDDTNFYVGDNVDWGLSANTNATNYGWVAFG